MFLDDERAYVRWIAWIHAYKRVIEEPDLPLLPSEPECSCHGTAYDPACGECGPLLTDAAWEALLASAGPLPSKAQGWCPAHGGVPRCCGLWQDPGESECGQLKNVRIQAVQTRHVHEATNDPAGVMAFCPLCTPSSRPAIQQEGQTSQTIAYQVLQDAADRRRHLRLVRKEAVQSSQTRVQDAKERQGRLL